MPLEKICKHKFNGECKDSSTNPPCQYICNDYEEMDNPTTEIRKDTQETNSYLH